MRSAWGASGRRSIVFVAAVLLALGFASACVAAGIDWPAFLFGPGHASTNPAATAVTPATAGELVRRWRWRPDPPTMPGQSARLLYSSPTVVDGRIYVGAGTGV